MAGAPSRGGVRVVVAGQPQPLVLMAGAPFAVRVCRALLRVLTPSRWCSWRVLLSLAYTDAPIGYVYTRHMSQPHSNAWLA